MLPQLCDPVPAHTAQQQAREGPLAEQAQTVPMCQQSSYFIIYLRAEVGGWVFGGRKQRMCEEWGILGERDGRELWRPAVPRALDHLYITPLLRDCVCVGFRVHACLWLHFFFLFSIFFFYANAKIPGWDNASVRCHISKTPPFKSLARRGRWDECVGEREGRAGTRCRVLLSARFGSYCMHVT